MNDKIEELLAALDPEDVKELLGKLIEKKTPPPEDGIIRLNTQTDTSQTTATKKSAHIFRPVSTEARPNRFLEMPEADMYKSDTKTDKKLWGKTTSSRRRGKAPKYAISCSRCGQEYILSNLAGVSKDPDTGEYVYVCDHCIPHTA